MVVIHGLGDLGVSEERLLECRTTFLSCKLFSKRGVLSPNNITSAKNKKCYTAQSRDKSEREESGGHFCKARFLPGI